jgi:hypothetical protein
MAGNGDVTQVECMLGGEVGEHVLVGLRGRSCGWIVAGEYCRFVAVSCTV